MLFSSSIVEGDDCSSGEEQEDDENDDDGDGDRFSSRYRRVVVR